MQGEMSDGEMCRSEANATDLKLEHTARASVLFMSVREACVLDREDERGRENLRRRTRGKKISVGRRERGARERRARAAAGEAERGGRLADNGASACEPAGGSSGTQSLCVFVVNVVNAA
mmetsp:Transcript_9972/g.26587  ORF Transcript_9972/g.26587 Transcript_9972/m.26587 type:complete len:120 (-) Transcript_9972:498-857(-)